MSSRGSAATQGSALPDAELQQFRPFHTSTSLLPLPPASDLPQPTWVEPERTFPEANMRARRTLWFISSAVASTIGCTDSVSPQDFVGDYVLTHIHGDPLPARMFDNDISPTIV